MYTYMGACQNYGPLLGTRNVGFRIIRRTQKGSILLTSTHIHTSIWLFGSLVCLLLLGCVNSYAVLQQLPGSFSHTYIGVYVYTYIYIHVYSCVYKRSGALKFTPEMCDYA